MVCYPPQSKSARFQVRGTVATHPTFQRRAAGFVGTLYAFAVFRAVNADCQRDSILATGWGVYAIEAGDKFVYGPSTVQKSGLAISLVSGMSG